MIKQFKHKDITWLDIQSPSKDDMATVSKNYNIHSLVVNEMNDHRTRSRADFYDGYAHVVLHFPVCELCYAEKPKKDDQEVHFIIGKDFLITVRYEHIQALSEFGQIFEASMAVPNRVKEENLHAGYLFFQILRQLYRSLDLGLDVINDELLKVKKDVFSGKEREMVRTLSDIHHNLIDFQWSIRSHDEVLRNFELISADMYGVNYSHNMKILRNECSKIWDSFTNIKQTFNDIRRTNESLLTIKTNEVMKILTILAFVTFPLSVFTSLFGMNTEYLPFVGRPNDFWIIVIIMLLAVTVMFGFFKYKKWF